MERSFSGAKPKREIPRRSNKLEMNKKLNLEEQADAQALNGFMQPRAIVPGGSMLPLPSQGSLPSGLNGGNEGQQVGNIKPKTEKKHHQQGLMFKFVHLEPCKSFLMDRL